MKLQPKNFRIGNLLREANSGQIVSVLALTEKTITLSGSFKGTWQAERIQLSEYFIVKLGFELKARHNFNCYSLPNGFHVCFWTCVVPCAGFEVTGRCYYGEDYIAIDTVDQLQNLYFSLTGKELVYES